MSPQERRAADRSADQAKADEVKNTKSEKQQSKQDKIDADKAARDERAKIRREVQDRADARQSKLLDARNKDRELKKQESERKSEKVKQNAEDNKKRALERNKKNAAAALADRTAKMRKLEVGFDNVEKDDGLGTAFSKFGANMTQLGQKTARGTANFAKREFPVLGQRARLRQAKRELKNAEKSPKTKKEINTKAKALPPGKKEEPIQKVKVSEVPPKQTAQKALPPARSTAAPQRKALPPGRSTAAPQRKALPAAKAAPERKALPAAKQKGTYVGKKYTITQGSGKGGSITKKPDGGAGSLTRAVDKANNQRAAKSAQTTSSGDYASKADRIAAFKKRRAADKASGVKMREEFLQEVEKMKKEKVDKVINIMRGKNKIETMPKVSESKDWRDGYKPLEFETVDLIKPEPLKPSNWRNDIEEASAAWTRKSGKNKSGGLNEKGRKSYESENPGSDLKAPSKKVGNPRRKSFCARMKGMKKKLTSSKTARDPDSRINKSLRAWNC